MAGILQGWKQAIMDDPVSRGILDLSTEIPAHIFGLTKDFLSQPGDVDEFMRRRGYEGEFEYPVGMEMVPMADTLGDAAFTAISAEDFANDPSLMNAGKTALGGVLTATPFVSAAMLKALGGVLMPSMVKAFHGTPHKVDKFEMDKIGTGEGAQAYGRGLYFAENPKVATSYGGTASPSNIEDIATWAIGSVGEENAVQALRTGKGLNAGLPQSLLDEAAELIETGKYKPQGNLYNINLDVNKSDLLDWDAPLSEQSDSVKKAIDKLPGDVKENVISMNMLGEEPDGHLIYNRVNAEDPEAASRMLNEAGIPGIKYFDAGSRSGGEGTHNIVMFDEDLIEIVNPKALDEGVLGGVDEGVLGGNIRNQPSGGLSKADRADLLAKRGTQSDIVDAVDDYQGQHAPSMRDGGAPAHDLTGGGDIYPDDVYSGNAVRYYGTGETRLDSESFGIVNRLKGNPNAEVTIYRAVPSRKSADDLLWELEADMKQYQRRNNVPKRAENGLTGSEWYNDAYDRREDLRMRLANPRGQEIPQAKLKIGKGDWVTINKGYAKQHGESTLKGDYKIIQKKVKAKDIFTSGDSIHEWGYDP